MTLTFPFVPTQSEIYDTFQNCGLYEIIKTLENLRVHVPRPNKPIQPKDISSTGYREYADKLKTYEVELEEYRNDQAKCSIFNIKVDVLIHDFVCEESGLNTIPEQYRNKVFSKAWSDGHSGGYYEVYQELCELVEIFN